ncbi:uncharacterized protein FFFS_03624 [Fusarium fujikuroi]|nr:uncharacterized protein FFFS_03624 [Fusarium fujikuroi]
MADTERTDQNSDKLPSADCHAVYKLLNQ